MFPKTVEQVTRIRLDIAEAVCVTDIVSIDLRGADQNVIWQWSGDLNIFKRSAQVALIGNLYDGQVGCTAVALGPDPQFELDLPPYICSQIRANCVLNLTVVPYELVERLPALMHRLAMLVTQPDSVLMLKPSVSFAQPIRTKLSSGLQEIATVLAQTLASRDDTIAQQRQQIVRMRDELIRAETQLHLLKDLLLSYGGQHLNAGL